MVYLRKREPAESDVKGHLSRESGTAHGQGEHLRDGCAEYSHLAINRSLRRPRSDHRLHDEDGDPAENRPEDCHQAGAIRGQALAVEHVKGPSAEWNSPVTLRKPVVQYWRKQS